LRVHHTTIITWLKAVEKLLPDAYTREQIPDVSSRRGGGNLYLLKKNLHLAVESGRPFSLLASWRYS
jgi:hypothetical protein